MSAPTFPIEEASGFAASTPEGREVNTPTPQTEERQDAVASFGHHPEPATDFCVEVDAIEAELIDLAAGLPATMDVGARIERAMQFRVGGSAAAVVAKSELRRMETAFKAARALSAPQREGWQWVPTEPTAEMLAAASKTPGVKAIDAASTIHQLRGNPIDPCAFLDGSPLQQAYRSMLASAPEAPTDAAMSAQENKHG